MLGQEFDNLTRLNNSVFHVESSSMNTSLGKTPNPYQVGERVLFAKHASSTPQNEAYADVKDYASMESWSLTTCFNNLFSSLTSDRSFYQARNSNSYGTSYAHNTTIDYCLFKVLDHLSGTFVRHNVQRQPNNQLLFKY